MYLKARNILLTLFLACTMVLGVGLVSSPNQGTAHAINIKEFSREEVDALAQKLGYNSFTPESIPADIKENCQTIYNLSREYGLNTIAAEAQVINNIEESKCNPGIVEVGGFGGYGIFQYTGENRYKFEAWAKENGKPVDDISAQIEYWYDVYSSYGFPGANSGMLNYCKYTADFFSCDNLKTYNSLDEWKNADNIVEATYAFMAVLERPTAQLGHVTTNRLVMAMYLEGMFAAGDSGASTAKEGNKGTADDETISIQGTEAVAEEDLTGFVKQGSIEGGKDLEFKSRDSLTVAEDQVLAQHQEHIETNRSSFGTMIQVLIASLGLLLILYGLILLGLGILDTVNTFITIPTFQLATFGVWKVVHYSDDADFKAGRIMLKEVMLISGGVVVLGMALASGVFSGIFAGIIYTWL